MTTLSSPSNTKPQLIRRGVTLQMHQFWHFLLLKKVSAIVAYLKFIYINTFAPWIYHNDTCIFYSLFYFSDIKLRSSYIIFMLVNLGIIDLILQSYRKIMFILDEAIPNIKSWYQCWNCFIAVLVFKFTIGVHYYSTLVSIG